MVENHKYKGRDGGILNYSNPIKCYNILQMRETPTWEENIRNSRTSVVILVSNVWITLSFLCFFVPEILCRTFL